MSDPSEITVTTQAELDAAILAKVPRIIVVGGTSSNRLNVRGSRKHSSVEAREHSSIVARDHSSVEAWEHSSVVAHGNSSVVAYGNSSVVAYGNSSVEARDHSSVEAWEHSSVVAYGNSSVVAYGNSSVEAREHSSVEAWEHSSVVAWGNTSIKAHGKSSVVAGKWTAVYQTLSHRGQITGGVLIKQPDCKTPAEWCAYHGVSVTDGIALLYKAVDQEYWSRHGAPYVPLTETVAPDWDGGLQKCGSGLHFATSPGHTLEFIPDEWKRQRRYRFIACGVRLEDMAVHPQGQYPLKCKASKCLNLYECDRQGEPITEKAEPI